MKFLAKASVALISISLCGASYATETTAYTYDAKGRLVRVVKSGGPDSGTTTTYDQDKADNRKRVATTGALR